MRTVTRVARLVDTEPVIERMAAASELVVSRELFDEWWTVEVDTWDEDAESAPNRAAFVAAMRTATKRDDKRVLALNPEVVAYLHDPNGAVHQHDDPLEERVKSRWEPEEERALAKTLLKELRRLQKKFPKPSEGSRRVSTMESCPYTPGKNVAEYMAKEHAEIEELLQAVTEATEAESQRKQREPGEARQRFEQFAIDLEQHFLSEERDIFPVARKLGGKWSKAIDGFLAQHPPIRALIAEQRQRHPRPCLLALGRLRDLIAEHTQAENALDWSRAVVPSSRMAKMAVRKTGDAEAFLNRFKERDALVHVGYGRDITAQMVDEVAWELGYEHEPYSNEFEGFAQTLGVDLRAAWETGRAAAPDRIERMAVAAPTPGHFYHTTAYDMLPEIAEAGLVPRQGGGVFQHGGYDAHSQGKVFLAAGEQAALSWFGKVADMLEHTYGDDDEPDRSVAVLLRVTLPEGVVPSVDPVGDRDVRGSFELKATIPPDAVDFYDPQAKTWRPVEEWEEADIPALVGVQKVEHYDDEGDVVSEHDAWTSRGFFRFGPYDRGGFKPDYGSKQWGPRSAGGMERMRAHKDQIRGGRADTRQPSEFDPEALRVGTQVELEHTSDPTLAREIAMDHLAEFPDYYDAKRGLPAMERRLARMESFVLHEPNFEHWMEHGPCRDTHYRKRRCPLSESQRARVYVRRLPDREGYAVWLVNGTVIRNEVDTDFIGGGNPGRYGYVPEGELWLDNALPEGDIEPFLVHELVECRHMIDDGMSYEDAHDRATQAERQIRDRAALPRMERMAANAEHAWLSLDLIERLVPEMERRGVSEVARSRRGFLAAYRRAGGDPNALGDTPRSTPDRAPYPWRQRREEFVRRHVAQVQQTNGESLWDSDGAPTDRHLALVAWAYSPDRQRLEQYVRRQGTMERMSTELPPGFDSFETADEPPKRTREEEMQHLLREFVSTLPKGYSIAIDGRTYVVPTDPKSSPIVPHPETHKPALRMFATVTPKVRHAGKQSDFAVLLWTPGSLAHARVSAYAPAKADGDVTTGARALGTAQVNYRQPPPGESAEAPLEVDPNAPAEGECSLLMGNACARGLPIVRIGLPYGDAGRLLEEVHQLGAPTLLSIGSMFRDPTKSKRGKPPEGPVTGFPMFRGFTPIGAAAWVTDSALDSAGFTAMLAGGYRWSPADYVDFVVTNRGDGAMPFPWRWWSSMDYCVEPQIAKDRVEVERRMRLTVETYGEILDLLNDWRREGVTDVPDPMPILQGRTAEDYAWSAKAMAAEIDQHHECSCPYQGDCTAEWHRKYAGLPELVGIGSVCRRELHGPEGLLTVLKKLDDVLPGHVKLHLFGVKGETLDHLGPYLHRVHSIDSMAWDKQAQEAVRDERRRKGVLHVKKGEEGYIPSTVEQRAGVMREWHGKQQDRLKKLGEAKAREPQVPDVLFHNPDLEIEAQRMAAAGQIVHAAMLVGREPAEDAPAEHTFWFPGGRKIKLWRDGGWSTRNTNPATETDDHQQWPTYRDAVEHVEGIGVAVPVVQLAVWQAWQDKLKQEREFRAWSQAHAPELKRFWIRRGSMIEHSILPRLSGRGPHPLAGHRFVRRGAVDKKSTAGESRDMPEPEPVVSTSPSGDLAPALRKLLERFVTGKKIETREDVLGVLALVGATVANIEGPPQKSLYRIPSKNPVVTFEGEEYPLVMWDRHHGYFTWESLIKLAYDPVSDPSLTYEGNEARKKAEQKRRRQVIERWKQIAKTRLGGRDPKLQEALLKYAKGHDIGSAKLRAAVMAEIGATDEERAVLAAPDVFTERQREIRERFQWPEPGPDFEKRAQAHQEQKQQAYRELDIEFGGDGSPREMAQSGVWGKLREAAGGVRDALRKRAGALVGYEVITSEEKEARKLWRKQQGFERPPKPRGYEIGVFTCGWCFEAHAVNTDMTVVHHGYQRPGHGYIVGDCHGVGFLPWELGYALQQEQLRRQLESSARTVQTLRDGFSELWVPQLDAKGKPIPRLHNGQPYMNPFTGKLAVELEAIHPGHPRWADAERKARIKALHWLFMAWDIGFGSIPWIRMAIRTWQRSEKGPVGAPDGTPEGEDFAGKPPEAAGRQHAVWQRDLYDSEEA